MRAPGSRERFPWIILAVLLAPVLAPEPASAQRAFVYGNAPIHPACLHALVMSEGDSIPVVSEVRVDGCMASDRAKATPTYEKDWYVLKDDALLGGGSFSYRDFGTLENGIFILSVHRVHPDGSEHFSLAAVALTTRPMLVDHEVVGRKVLEMIGEIWLHDLRVASLSINGNIVGFSAGLGPDRIDETIDLSRIAKAMRN